MRYLHKKSSYLLAVLACVVLIIAFTLGGLTARLTTKHRGTEEARVAVMAADVSVDIPASVGYPGAVEVIPVVLTNQRDGKICEVAQNYKFSIKRMTNNLPVTVKVYSDEACEEEVEYVENGVYSEGSFPAGQEESKTYYIQISWPVENKNPSLALEIDYLRVCVDAEQID